MSKSQKKIEIKDQKFDAIVVGAGLGGLGAATQLASEDKRVLLLEKHSSPGGFATSFIRGRFEFEGALHELSGFGNSENPGGIYKYFNKLGLIPDKMNFYQVPELYSCKFYDGEKYDLPFGVENFQNYLIERFPTDEEDIRRFTAVIKNINEGLHGSLNPLRLLLKFPWVIRASAITIDEFLDRFFSNIRLKNVISVYWCYLGASPGEGNAILFVGALMSYLEKGAAFPSLRSHNLSSLLAKYVEDHNGLVKYNALVNKFILDHGAVVGVEMINGEKYYADGVISNINPVCTINKMLPKDSLPKSYIKRVMAPHYGPSIFTVYLGLNKTPEELGIDTYETFLFTSDNVNEDAKATGVNETRMIVVTVYNLVHPNISPKGTTMVALGCLHQGKEWHSVPANEYHKIKDRIANEMISIFENYMCPNVRDSIEECEIASPLTYYRYSKSLDGSIYGTNNSIYNSPIFKLQNKTPLKKFYFAGCWVNQGGGFDPALESGRSAAFQLMRELNDGGRK